MLAGNSDDFKVARSYLTQEAAAVWNPLESVTIYQSGEAPAVAGNGPQLGRVTLTLTTVGSVDHSGRYSPQEPSRHGETLSLSQGEDSQWRISALPDGIVIPEDVFHGDYLETRIYFPSADGRFLVPDLRVFARSGAATAAVKEFLAGPPPYLTGAVEVVVPPGTRLLTDTVRVADGLATVNLSSGISRASETARATILASLRSSLTALPKVEAVELQVESVPLEVNQAAGLEVDPLAIEGPFYVGDSGVWRVRDGSSQMVEGTGAAAGWESLAVDHTLDRMAGLEGGRVSVINRASGLAKDLVWPDKVGPDATAGPAFDRLGWLWAAAGSAVVAFPSDGAPVRLGATWLEGRRVVALAPARDGTRLALAVESEAGVELLVSGIVRSEGAVPWRLTGPSWAGHASKLVGGLSWADDVSLAFLTAPTEAGELVPAILAVGGDTTYLKSPTDPPGFLAAGRGASDVYVSGRSGGLFAYAPRGRVWTSLASGARAVALAP
jgi:hypothetical protein